MRILSQTNDIKGYHGLAETVHNLTIEKDTLFDKTEELKAEVERLKKNETDIDNFCRGLCKERMFNGNAVAKFEDLQSYINKVKSEAVKEFAERLKDMSEHFWQEKENFVSEEQIDNLVKEMVGEDNVH